MKSKKLQLTLILTIFSLAIFGSSHAETWRPRFTIDSPVTDQFSCKPLRPGFGCECPPLNTVNLPSDIMYPAFAIKRGHNNINSSLNIKGYFGDFYITDATCTLTGIVDNSERVDFTLEAIGRVTNDILPELYDPLGSITIKYSVKDAVKDGDTIKGRFDSTIQINTDPENCVYMKIGQTANGEVNVLVKQTVRLGSLNAAMVSPEEIGIGARVQYPIESKGKKRYLNIRSKINNKPVDYTFDVTDRTTAGREATIGLGINGDIDRKSALRLNLAEENVPRFEENVKFTVKAIASYDGGYESSEEKKEVDVLLPIVVLHGYIAQIPYLIIPIPVIPDDCDVKGYPYGITSAPSCASCGNKWKYRLAAYEIAYKPLSKTLSKFGYQTLEKDEHNYVTLWDPSDRKIGYSSLSFSSAANISKDFQQVFDLVKKNSYADKFNTVAHSTGGLAARYWAGLFGDKMNKVVTVGTPHDGIARFYQEPFLKRYTNREDFSKECLMTTVGGKTPNILTWFVPRWKSAVDVSLIDPMPTDPNKRPYFKNSFQYGFPPDVKFYLIYADKFETPHNVTIRWRNRSHDWYTIKPLEKDKNFDKGDAYVFWKSAAAKYSGPRESPAFHRYPIPRDSISKNTKHGNILLNAWVQNKIVKTLCPDCKESLP